MWIIVNESTGSGTRRRLLDARRILAIAEEAGQVVVKYLAPVQVGGIGMSQEPQDIAVSDTLEELGERLDTTQ